MHSLGSAHVVIDKCGRSKITFIAWSPDDAGIKVSNDSKIDLSMLITLHSPKWSMLRPRTL